IEELARGRVHGRTTGHVAIADDAHPVALQQGAHDLRVDGDATDLLDLATGDRLAIGNQCQRLENRAAVTRRLFLPLAADTLAHFLAYLKTETGRHFAQLDAAIG